MFWLYCFVGSVLCCDIIEQAKTLLNENFDSDLNGILPGSLEEIGFQHLEMTSSLLSIQAIAHWNITSAIDQYKTILTSQWKNGFFPHIIYGSSIDPLLQWLPTNKTYLPGPGFWKTNTSTSGIMALPLHGEIALRIFRLAPLDTLIGSVTYQPYALQFLCEILPSLYQFHQYIIRHRTKTPSEQSKSSGILLATTHPWEMPQSIHFYQWNEYLKNISLLPDFQQTIEQLNISSQAEFFYLQQSQQYQHHPAQNYQASLYLIHCFQKYNYDDKLIQKYCPFRMIHVEFNSIFLKSNSALIEIMEILQQNYANACPNLSSYSIDLLKDWNYIIRESMVNYLYDRSTNLFQDLPSSSPSILGLLPFFAIRFNESVNMQLLNHFFTSRRTEVSFSACDYYMPSIYPCGHNPRRTMPFYNYLLYRGLEQNSMTGMASYIMNQTKDRICHANISFSLIYQSTKLQQNNFSILTTSSLSAASILNMILPPFLPPPDPNAPPINRSVTIIVMCVELIIALAVASSCVVFSVYFIATRPPAGSLSTSKSQPQPADAILPVEEVNLLKETLLLKEEDDHEYGTYDQNSTSVRAASSIKSFLASISPWQS